MPWAGSWNSEAAAADARRLDVDGDAARELGPRSRSTKPRLRSCRRLPVSMVKLEPSWSTRDVTGPICGAERDVRPRCEPRLVASARSAGPRATRSATSCTVTGPKARPTGSVPSKTVRRRCRLPAAAAGGCGSTGLRGGERRRAAARARGRRVTAAQPRRRTGLEGRRASAIENGSRSGAPPSSSADEAVAVGGVEDERRRR